MAITVIVTDNFLIMQEVIGDFSLKPEIIGIDEIRETDNIVNEIVTEPEEFGADSIIYL